MNHTTGAGVSGVKVDLRATDAGGYTAAASTTTDATGVWQATVDKVHGWLKEAGRDPSRIGIEGRIGYGQGSPAAWMKDLQAWQDLGATHVGFNTMKAGLNSAAHIEAIRRFSAAVNGQG